LIYFFPLMAVVSFTYAADEPLRMGVFPRVSSAETAKAFSPMADYLSERLGRRVTLVTSKNFELFWKAVTEQQYDIVHYNQYHYIRSAHMYQVIAHIEESGKGAIAGALYVRKDSGITELSQLRGRTVMFGGGKDAMLSYIAPQFLLMQAGLKQGDFKNQFSVSPPNAIVALYHKQADAAGGGGTLIDLPLLKNAINTEEITILAATEPLLFLPWAVKRGMPAKLRTSIQSILVELKDSEAGRQVLKSAVITGIGKAEDKDYEPHRKMASAVFASERNFNGQSRPHESGIPTR
jgi:phosphonate transport system substrate-binding protein